MEQKALMAHPGHLIAPGQKQKGSHMTQQLDELLLTGTIRKATVGVSITDKRFFCTLQGSDWEPVGSGHGHTSDLAIIDALDKCGFTIKMPGM